MLSVLVLSLVASTASGPVSWSCASATGGDRGCSVLVVHSYHSDLEWNRALSRGLASAFGTVKQLRLDAEFLDAKRRPRLEHGDVFIELLRTKYGAHPPDVLMVSDDPAFELLYGRHHALFPDVPIVFFGLNAVREELLGGVDGVTGIFEKHETEQTLELAFELTGAGGVIIVNDTSETGAANMRLVDRLKALHSEIEWHVRNDLTVAEVAELRKYPSDWPVIPMLPLREARRDGPMISQRRSIRHLRRVLANPLFYDTDWLIGSGLVGGYMVMAEEHARQAGEIAIRVLRGARPKEIPAIVDEAHRWVFDQRELDRFGWSVEALPPGSEIRYAKRTYLERHAEFIYPALVGIVAAGVVIAVLSFLVARQRRVEKRLRDSERRLWTALSATHAGVLEVRSESQTYASARWLEFTGAAEEPPGVAAWIRSATPESGKEFVAAIERLRGGQTDRERVELRVRDATRLRIIDVLFIVDELTSSAERLIVGVALDVTDRRRLEEENARRERLNALGKLAGGIAHDFNNVLTVINSNADEIRELADLAEIRRRAEEVSKTGARAADLVRQLLAFGRHEDGQSCATDLNVTVNTVQRFLRRLIGVEHRLVTSLSDEPAVVELQRSQLEQILTNLVVNARDALPMGGTIEVETKVLSGEGMDWSVLLVKDNGVGMDDETRQRLFEPFFTTKGVGQGTGLGLSTVYGIVSASGGQIQVISGPYQGTTFMLRWPRVRPSETEVAHAPPKAVCPAGKSILVVEDDPNVAILTRRVLERVGYAVFSAFDGDDGLNLFSRRPEGFDLVLSDVVLPRMSGIDMVSAIRQLDPSVCVGFMSGYHRHSTLKGMELPPEAPLLQKPFSKAELTDYVARCLAETDRAASA